jgi:tetratricopeptide (TPR) repeat protein
MWQAKPIFGWGLDNYKWGFLKHFIPQMVNNNPNDVNLGKAHNMPLEILATTGIVGFSTFLFFYCCVALDLKMIWISQNYSHLLILPLALGMIAYFVFNIFLFDVFESFLTLPLALLAIDSLKNEKISPKKTNKSLNILFLIVAALCILVFVYSDILKPFQTSIDYGMANYYIKKHKADKALALLLKTTNEDNFAVRKDLIGLCMTYTEEADYLDDNSKIQITNILSQELDKEIERFPMFLDLQSLQVRLNLYGSLPTPENISKATAIQQKLVDYAPDFLNYRVDQAFLYGLKGDFDKSLEESNFVLSKTSKLPQAFWYKGIVLYQKGQRQEAMNNYLLALQNGYGISTSDLQTLKTSAQLNNRQDILNYIQKNYKDPAGLIP